MAAEENMIPVEPYLEDFKQYLDANSRCILSAKFGNGKSYFVNRFMKQYSDEFLFIPIYPVNYQVMDNKDIFELIKRDILIRLLSSEEININEIELNTASLLYYYFRAHPGDNLLDILGIIPDISIYGVDIKISNVIKKLKEIKRKFDLYKEQFETDDKTSELYITEFDDMKGSIYEFDAISQLICDIILEYRKQKSNKQVVLIIEDLDRIDPGHIFRILNVFSAHFDRYTPSLIEFDKTCGDNKFCLDKIVTVCDINNIKNIYSHVYGIDTDFIGYISKFSNSKEFNYSLKDKLKEYIINTLLDKDLLKYPEVCHVLSDKIISSMDKNDSMENNLRIIKERIGKISCLVRKVNIELDQDLSGKYIKSESDFIKLLSVLKIFDFHFRDIGIDYSNRELVKMVGKYWILASRFDDNLKFSVNVNCIDVKYCETFGQWNRSHIIKNGINGEEIIDFNLSNFDSHLKGISLIFRQLNNIVDYLNKEVLI